MGGVGIAPSLDAAMSTSSVFALVRVVRSTELEIRVRNVMRQGYPNKCYQVSFGAPVVYLTTMRGIKCGREH